MPVYYTTLLNFFSGGNTVGISTIARTEHNVAQTREVACTKVVIPQVIARGRLINFEDGLLLLCLLLRTQYCGGCTRHAASSIKVCDW